MKDAVSEALPGVTLALHTVVVALVRKEPRRWSESQRKYLAPLWTACGGMMGVTGVFALWSRRPIDSVMSARTFVGCGYFALGILLVLNTWWPTRRSP